jgi:glycosyltransferase involved in cell wall biosynthesis
MHTEEITPRRVLVIAYYFPPMGLSGVQRTLKFVKYFPVYGWHPTVLTVEAGGYFAEDETLLADIASPEIRVVRTAPAGPGKVFGAKEVVRLPSERTRKLLSRLSDTLFIPDNKRGWIHKAVKRAQELHQENPFDLIFSTAPPFTDFIIGAEIKSKINRPLVFDYRDPWVDYPFKFYPTPIHKWANKFLERRALRASSHVITTNRRVKELLIQRYPFLTYHDIDIIPQGFDPDDLRPAGKLPQGEEERDSFEQPAGAKSKGKKKQTRDKMRIAYAGVFWEDRKPDYFLRALSALFREQPKLRGRIEAVFVGNFRDENMKLANKLGLQDSVTVTGYLPHRECIRHLLDADVLWVIVGDDLGSPGKTYEYIGAQKPILGCVPEGFLKTTILEAGGTVVPPTDVEGIKRALSDFFALFTHHALGGPRDDVVEKYDRRMLTGSLVKIFETLLSG